MIRRASHGRSRLILLVAAVSGIPPLRVTGQTTQGLISGLVQDLSTGKPISGSSLNGRDPQYGVVVFYCRIADHGAIGERGWVQSDEKGYYVLASLSPGEYRLRADYRVAKQLKDDFLRLKENECFPAPATNPKFQAQEKHDLTLAVAARMEVDFGLRPAQEVSDPQAANYLTPRGLVIRYFGADDRVMNSVAVDTGPASQQTGGSTVSYVVDPPSAANLPLNGRDIYTALVLQPGVTADTGTARGLGLSANGQRPTASSYLLDGIENNNALVTGPLTSLAPEMIQEYRISTSSWSAEYGGTAGFLANAITRAGGATWHAAAYFDLKNDALDANTFENNSNKVPRLPFKEAQYGFQAGGPLWKRKLFFSAGLETYRSRGFHKPEPVNVPSPLALTQAKRNGSDTASALLTNFPTPATDPGMGNVTTLTVRPTVSLDRYVGLARADYVSGALRLMLRIALNRFDWPDFIWDPYQQFRSGLTQPLSTVAVGYSGAIQPNLIHELHAGWSRNTIRWDRPHPEIPTTVVGQAAGQPQLYLPGSPLLYGLRDTDRDYQFNDTWSWVRARHIVRLGGGALLRSLDSIMTTGRDAEVIFPSMNFFLFDEPSGYSASVDRLSPQLRQPAFGRSYGNTQFFFFGEDTWRVGRVVLNAGLRYENFGSPVNTGALKDALVQLGSGASFPERIASATLISPGPGDQKLWAADHKNLAPRFGFAWDPGRNAPVVRGGYGIFFDRPFDNLWENVAANGLVVPVPFSCSDFQCEKYLDPVSTMLPLFAGKPFAKSFPSLTLIDPKLRSGYTQSYFLGLQKRLSDSWEVELNTLGALGRRLLTTDVVNRLVNSAFSLNAGLQDDIQWRSNQGASDYNALAAVARYRSRRGMLQVSYTWSHSIDNQSDPLAGDFFDPYFTNVNSSNASSTKAAFTQQFKSHADRATSDFDQRHNLLFYSWWDVPSFRRGRVLDALTGGWHFSQMAAFRTGFPYTVTSAATGGLKNQRADIVNPSQILAPAGLSPAPGTVLILNPAAFAAPPIGVVGNSGRNAFRGPGLYNIDVSLSRSFSLPFLGESSRLLVRSDFYNAFNHANLDNPKSLLPEKLEGSDFGQASYGRVDYNTGFKALTPLKETPRQIQLIVKVEF